MCRAASGSRKHRLTILPSRCNRLACRLLTTVIQMAPLGCDHYDVITVFNSGYTDVLTEQISVPRTSQRVVATWFSKYLVYLLLRNRTLLFLLTRFQNLFTGLHFLPSFHVETGYLVIYSVKLGKITGYTNVANMIVF